MFHEIYKTEVQFLNNCPCAYEILEFIDNLKDTDVHWFFDHGFSFYNKNKYCIIFKSYSTPEYDNYVLSIEAIKTNDVYTIKIIKKIDNLLHDNV
ncbi:hypothetical protein [Clostridium novyi]|uniref:hypothetical protein n=1 Tax=Clostridium novyi TaxID=1542 RepID=UPI0004D53B8B|nr:hypothetical protein [Clostridium novyi]KEI11771.1 hypothetical protein Z958_08570 [Clostridium novyi B str. NCTC 9691]